MRIAYFSPLPPLPSGIADYSAALLPYLARDAEIDIYIDAAQYVAPPPLAAQFTCRDISEFSDPAGRTEYDAVLYQMGNNPQHAAIYRTLMEQPGVIVLHDYVLHHLVQYLTHAQGKVNEYCAELAEAYGEAGWRHGLTVVNDGKRPDYFAFPLSGKAIRSATGVIVHSRFLQERLRREYPGVRVEHVPMLSHGGLPSEDSRAIGRRVRERLGLRPDQLLLGSFGFVVPTKRIDVALRAFRRLRDQAPGAHYLIVGAPAPEMHLDKQIRELGLQSAVTVTGSAPEDEFLDYLVAVDICVNLRYPTAGETSAALLRMLELGKVTIVSETDSFVEFPDDICVKVRPGLEEIGTLAAVLGDLNADPDKRRRLGDAARRWVERHHRPEDAATGYLRFLAACQSPPSALHPSVAVRLCDLLADALHDLGLGALSERALDQAVGVIADLSDPVPAPATPDRDVTRSRESTATRSDKC